MVHLHLPKRLHSTQNITGILRKASSLYGTPALFTEMLALGLSHNVLHHQITNNGGPLMNFFFFVIIIIRTSLRQFTHAFHLC